MKRKKTIRNVSVITRLTAEEFDFVNKTAEANDCSISHAVRLLVFMKKDLESDSENSVFDKSIVRAVEKKVNRINELVRDYISVANKKQSQVSERILRDILQIETEIKQILLESFTKVRNAPLVSACSEIQIPDRDFSAPFALSTLSENQKTSTEIDTNLKHFYYMQSITICGKITVAPRVFTAKNGAEMVVFTVSCYDEGSTQPVNYDAYISKKSVEKILPSLTPDRQVFVMGTFRLRSAANKKGEPQNMLSILADSVLVGMEKLN